MNQSSTEEAKFFAKVHQLRNKSLGGKKKIHIWFFLFFMSSINNLTGMCKNAMSDRKNLTPGSSPRAEQLISGLRVQPDFIVPKKKGKGELEHSPSHKRPRFVAGLSNACGQEQEKRKKSTSKIFFF